MRPSQILPSEKKVQKVMEVLLDDYINPFGTDFDKTKLVYLSSGAPLDDAVAETLLHVYDDGNIQVELFRKERLVNKTSLFHNPVKRCRFVNFKETTKSISIKKITSHYHYRLIAISLGHYWHILPNQGRLLILRKH